MVVLDSPLTWIRLFAGSMSAPVIASLKAASFHAEMPLKLKLFVSLSRRIKARRLLKSDELFTSICRFSVSLLIFRKSKSPSVICFCC